MTRAERQRHRQAKTPDYVAGAVSHGLSRLVKFGQNPLASRLELETRLRRGNAARRAAQEAGTKIGLHAGDYVLRAGLTFRYTETGPVGLVTNKRAIVVESRGGLYSEGPAQGLDSQEPHLRTLLGFIGVTDVAFVRAEKLAFGPEAREQAFATARAQLGRVVEGAELQAA